MSDIPTVRVHNPAEPGGYMIINADDFDPATHTEFEPVEAPPVDPATTTPPAPKRRRKAVSEDL